MNLAPPIPTLERPRRTRASDGATDRSTLNRTPVKSRAGAVRRERHQADYVILVVVVALTAIGILMVYSSSALRGYLSQDADTFSVTLTLPALGRLPVLVIDDNADTVQLLERYVSGTRYVLIGAQDPEAALELAARFAPQMIVLDVMMPQVDGWRLLGRLRQEPLTAGLPVIVCTILAQEELALHLGASGFIRKPVTRQAFLEALDHQLAPATESD